MASNVVPIHSLPAVGPGQPHDSRQHPASDNTYGCLQPFEIDALSALVDDLHRTQAHILWLEAFIAQLPATGPGGIFSHTTQTLQTEHEQTRFGKPTPSGQLAYQAELRRRNITKQATQVLRTHPAIHELQAERRHLVDVAFKAISLGVKLDSIDFSRQQADMLVEAMGEFAKETNHDLNDADIQAKITKALELVIQRHSQ